jgi:hypothetical protein
MISRTSSGTCADKRWEEIHRFNNLTVGDNGENLVMRFFIVSVWAVFA